MSSEAIPDPTRADHPAGPAPAGGDPPGKPGNRPTPSRSRRPVLLAFAACATLSAFAAGIGCARAYDGTAAFPPSASSAGEDAIAAPPDMAVVRTATATVSLEETFTGEFRPFDEVELRPEVAGFLKSIAVDEGDQVTAGEIIAVLDVPGLDDDISRAGAQIAHDQAAADTAAANRTAYHQTWQRIAAVATSKEHLVAQQDIDDAKQHDDAAEAAWQAEVSQIKISQAEHQRLLTLAGFRQITAPFAGIITARHADPGALVQGGVSPGANAPALVTLSRNDRLRLSFPVEESLVPRIAIGSPLSVAIGALGERITGKVARFTRKLDLRTRTMEVEADIDNPGLEITPGMYAEVGFVAERHTDVLALPPQALRRRATAVSAYVVGQDGRIREQQLTLGLEGADLVEVTSGVKAGDLVVFGHLDEVKAGMAITPRVFDSGSEGVRP
jgi:RND family efflux transporter MFP subunit